MRGCVQSVETRAGACWNVWRVSGERLVNFQSSRREVGKPRSRKRSIAERRRSSSQLGTSVERRSKSAKNGLTAVSACMGQLHSGVAFIFQFQSEFLSA